ncbi:MAG: LURP-one-related family protein [Blautia sp.]|nr:LURP-one-related family protein [Blautia sp.]
MKKLFMKQNIFSNLDKFTVKNEEEADRYQVHGDNLQIGGKKLHIEDMSGREMAMVQQKLLALMPKFFVFQNGEKVAEIKKKMALFKAKYIVEGPGWEVKGSILDHDYTITDGGREIIRLHKAWFSWGDSYEIDISDGTDEALALAVVLAIDCVQAAQAEAASREE